MCALHYQPGFWRNASTPAEIARAIESTGKGIPRSTFGAASFCCMLYALTMTCSGVPGDLLPVILPKNPRGISKHRPGGWLKVLKARLTDRIGDQTPSLTSPCIKRERIVTCKIRVQKNYISLCGICLTTTCRITCVTKTFQRLQ